MLIYPCYIQAQQSIPYCDNFNGATLWTVTTISGSAWQQGSPAYGLTNSTHTPPNCFDVELFAAYQPSTETYLVSPSFNFSSVPNAKLSFWQNRNTEAGWDGTRLEYSTDNGISWAILGTVADPNASNWYSAGLINSSGLPAWDGISGGWIKSTYNVNFLNGFASVTFRFVFTSDPSVQADGFSIDDFCISLPPNTDLGVDSILSPLATVTAGTPVPVQVRVKNYGLLASSNFNVYYKLDNGTAIGPANYPGTILPGATANVTCSNVTIPVGSHVLSAYAVITNDGDHFNDTLSKNISAFTSASLTYCNNFDVANDWVAVPVAGSTNNWELGTPNFGTTSTAHSPPNSWDVNLNTACGFGAAELYSPVFDFSAATNCNLEFWQNNSTNFNTDGVTLFASVNGAPFTVFGTYLDPNAINWYSANVITSSGYPGWSGYYGGWAKSSYYLSSLNSAGLVQFKFYYSGNANSNGFSIDDFCIIQPQPVDAGVELIIEPSSVVPAATSQQVKVRVRNYGSQTLTSFNVFYKLDAGTVNGPVNFIQTILPNSTSDLVAGTITIPTGSHSLCAYTSVAGDGNTYNDTTCKSIFGASVIALPYSDNFDGVNYGWDATSTNPSTVWELGTPSFGLTSSSFSAPNCWDINLSTGYQSSANATLTSPIFDFTTTNDARLKFYINYNTEGSWDGVRCEYRSIDTIWHLLGAVGSPGSINWYNTPNLISSNLPGWAGSSGGWQPCEYDSLNMLNGSNAVQFRFIFTSDVSINVDGFSIDNFEITIPLANSVGTQAINAPGLLITPTPKYYQALIVNHGLSVLATADVSLMVDGSTVLTETATFNPPLNYNETRWYTFTNPWNAQPGEHLVCVYTSNPNSAIDLNHMDDTICYNYHVLDSASVYPYCNDFEGSVLWPAYNVSNWWPDLLWKSGVPFKPNINSAHSGTKCWVTDLSGPYGSNRNSALIGPAFAVQQGHCYRLSFWHEFFTEYLTDGGTVEFSLDEGFSWTVLGWAGDPLWFNTNYIYAFGNPPVTSGWSGTQTWTQAQHDFYADTTGTLIFRFRFGSNAGNNGYDGWAIDDVCFEEIASPCVAGINDFAAGKLELLQNEPNPADNITIIRFNVTGGALLRITDMLGNVIVSKTVSGNAVQIETSQFMPGIYTYELISGNKVLQKKMAVVH